MTKDNKIKASKAVRAFLSEIGRKGGHAGKGSPAVIAKMRRANEIRLAKKKARNACEIEKSKTRTPMKYLEDEQYLKDHCSGMATRSDSSNHCWYWKVNVF